MYPFVALPKPATTYAQLSKKLVPHAENSARLTAFAMRFEGSFICLYDTDGLHFLGTHGLGLQRLPASITSIPAWFMPTQPYYTTKNDELERLAVATNQHTLDSALGIAIITSQCVAGVLWLLNSLELFKANSAELLKACTDQFSHLLEQELLMSEFEQPHKIARERDAALGVVHSLPNGIMTTSANGTIESVNPMFGKQFGYTTRDLKNADLSSIILPNGLKLFRQAMQASAKGFSTLDRIQIRRFDKTIADVEFTACTRFDKHGVVLGGLATMRDISEEIAIEKGMTEVRKATQKKITDSLLETKNSLEQEKNFALEITETMQDGFALLDFENCFVYANPAFGELLAIHPNALVGLSAATFIYPDDLEPVRAYLSTLEPQKILTFEHRVRKATGAVISVKARCNLRLDQYGQRIGIIISAQDMTQRLLDQQALQHSQKQLLEQREMAMLIAQTTQEGFVLSKGVNIEFANTATEAILGLPTADLLGRNLLDFVHPDDLYLSKLAISAVQNGQEIKYRQRLIRADQSICYIDYHTKPRRSASGKIFGAIGNLKDVTQEIATDARVLHLETQLGQIQNSLQTGAGFSGRLETLGGAVGLMQMVAASPINGVIQLADTLLFLEQGRIVAAEHPRLVGQAAVEAIVQRKSGQFQFIPEVKASQKSLNLDPVQLALRHLTKLDEANAPLPETGLKAFSLPNAKAAKAFLAGVGGMGHFKATVEQNQVVLYGRGMKITVLDSQLNDY